jgi:hypothetical protein
MSYEPSHRKPPRQERWPNATPGEGWPAYEQGDGGRTRDSAAAFAGSRNGHGGARYGDAGYGYAGQGYVDQGYQAAGNGYGGDGYAGDGYADGFDDAQAQYGYDGWDSHVQPGHEFTGPAGYLAQDEYPELDPAASSVLVAPDTMGEWWRAEPSHDGDGDPESRGPVVGAVTGFLAAAVAIGVATFAAAFVRPQASPVSAVGGIFFDRIPATLRTTVMAHFGAHGKTVLLLGAIGLVALVLGCLARRNPSAGVAGIAAFGLLGAFVAITRPESRASDVIPSVIGGLAGIIALLWLARASAPVPKAASLRPAYGGGRRRTR